MPDQNEPRNVRDLRRSDESESRGLPAAIPARSVGSENGFKAGLGASGAAASGAASASTSSGTDAAAGGAMAAVASSGLKAGSGGHSLAGSGAGASPASLARVAGDAAAVDSLWTQAKLSFWTVGPQLLLGFLFALLLNLRSSLLRALRTVFLIPMVLPPIVVAIIWKVLYTPDISPFYWLFAELGWDVPSLITHADWALTAIIIADTWEWFPFTMLMILAALQMMPEEHIDAAGSTARTSCR